MSNSVILGRKFTKRMIKSVYEIVLFLFALSCFLILRSDSLEIKASNGSSNSSVFKNIMLRQYDMKADIPMLNIAGFTLKPIRKKVIVGIEKKPAKSTAEINRANDTANIFIFSRLSATFAYSNML